MEKLRKYLDASITSVHRLSDDQVIEEVARKLADGDVKMLKRRPAAVSRNIRLPVPSEAAEGTVPPPQSEPPKKEKTFVEIELLHEDGTPVSGAKYRIELPDGSKVEGTTDGKGRARHDRGLNRDALPDPEAEAAPRVGGFR
jgi:hypothetical protein